MAKTRRESASLHLRCTPAFKREAVALLERGGRPEVRIAAELGIQPSMLRPRRTTGEGWLYLAAVLDGATRKIVGWSMRA